MIVCDDDEVEIYALYLCAYIYSENGFMYFVLYNKCLLLKQHSNIIRQNAPAKPKNYRHIIFH